MSFSDRPPRQGGFVVIVTLLFAATFGVVLLAVWYQRQAAVAQLAAELRQTRLERELNRELVRLGSAAAATPGEGLLPGGALLIQALDNLLERGRNERLTLESQRQALLQLSQRSDDPAFRQEVRQRVRELNPRLQEARAWVRVLESQLLETYRQREAQLGSRPPPPAAPLPPRDELYMPAPIPPPG